jgi:hypothetical protein
MPACAGMTSYWFGARLRFEFEAEMERLEPA